MEFHVVRVEGWVCARAGGRRGRNNRRTALKPSDSFSSSRSRYWCRRDPFLRRVENGMLAIMGWGLGLGTGPGVGAGGWGLGPHFFTVTPHPWNPWCNENPPPTYRLGKK